MGINEIKIVLKNIRKTKRAIQYFGQKITKLASITLVIALKNGHQLNHCLCLKMDIN